MLQARSKTAYAIKFGKQMDILLAELFKVKSLQDQGKVEKPY
jgi:hypothetical protein